MTGIVAKRFVLSRPLSFLLLLGAQRGFSYTTSSDGEDSRCIRGLQGKLGRNDKPEAACCPTECPSCGGPGCGDDLPDGLTREDCCVGAINESQLNCEESDEAPCFYTFEYEESACLRSIITSDMVFEFESPDMTPQLCGDRCQPLAFFGITNGRFCGCSNGEQSVGDVDFQGFDRDDDDEQLRCDVPCVGDENFNCGGIESFRMYLVRPTNELAPTIPAPTPPTDPTEGSSCLDFMRGKLGRSDKPEAACCPTECPSCGGPGCGDDLPDGLTREDCCIGAIIESQPNCQESDEPPCFYTLEYEASQCLENTVMSEMVFEFDSPAMTPELCGDRCQPMAFFGVTDGRFCWCSDGAQEIDDIDFDGRTPSSNCDVPCTGDEDINCGGVDSMRIYTVEFTNN